MDCLGTSVRNAWISESYSSNHMDNYVLWHEVVMP